MCVCVCVCVFIDLVFKLGLLKERRRHRHNTAALFYHFNVDYTIERHGEEGKVIVVIKK